MINIESNTLIIKGKSYEQVVSEVIYFFDLEGKNVLYITDSKVEDTTMFQYLKCNKVTFTGADYKEVIKSNLYNVDIFVSPIFVCPKIYSVCLPSNLYSL